SMPSKAEQAQLKETFKSITECKNDLEVEQFLEAATWDVSTAVDLFFARAADNTSTRRRKEPTRQNGRPQRNGNGAGPSSRVEVTLSDDEEDVKHVVEPKRNGRAAAKPVPEVSIDDDDVRAPMAFKSGPIVQHTLEQQYGNGIHARNHVPNSAFDGIKDFRALAEQQKASLRNRLDQNGASTSAVTNNRSNVLKGGGDGKSKSLQSLFRPPIDILHAGDWESAKASALERECWILVNVQDMKEFASQTLNRDVWSNGGVKELVKSNFLFWQVCLDSVDGQRMRSYYGVHACPTVFIVDPRTGEKVIDVPLKSQDAVSICDKLTRFMDDFPDFATRDRSLIGHVAPVDLEPVPDEAQISMDEMMVECASTSTNGVRKRKGSGDEERDGKRSRMMDDKDMDRMLEESTRGLTMCDEDEWKKHVVPGGDPIKVMLRFPDGSKHVVDVTGSTRLFALHQYIRGRALMPEDHVFVLSYPKREYSTDRTEESLTQLGFSRSEMIHVETKE
ncbi:hypothetical protein PFISCL1PPCAC_24672, partial [Pristionchus fissidentatus]